MQMVDPSCQHCDEQQFRNTVMCTLHDFLSSKATYIYLREHIVLLYLYIFTMCSLKYMYVKKKLDFSHEHPYEITLLLQKKPTCTQSRTCCYF